MGSTLVLSDVLMIEAFADMVASFAISSSSLFGSSLELLAASPGSDASIIILNKQLYMHSIGRNLYGWILVRFICGALSLGYNNSLAVYGMETTHGKWRAILGNLFGELFWNLGHMSLGGLAYGIRNMYTLELVIGLSASPFILLWSGSMRIIVRLIRYVFCFRFVMPESPRWLLASGKKVSPVQPFSGLDLVPLTLLMHRKRPNK